MNINRRIDEQKINQSKQRTLEFVMEEIKPIQKRTISFSKYKYVLTTLIFLITILTITLTNTLNSPLPQQSSVLGHYESERLAEVSYISGSIIKDSFTLTNSNNIFLNNTETTEFETNIDEFNVYFDMLKVFLSDGDFEDQITVTEGNEEYSTEIRFQEDNEEFVFLVNIKNESLEGVLQINGLTLDVTGLFKTTDEEIELKIKAENGSNYVEIEYKVESDDEIERKYEIKQNINDIYSEKEIKIEFGENETKVELKENEDSYELKRELEEGIWIYKLEYEVNGISGEVQILELIESGVVTYRYIIEENGKHKEIDLDDPDHESDEESEDTKRNTFTKIKKSTI